MKKLVHRRSFSQETLVRQRPDRFQEALFRSMFVRAYVPHAQDLGTSTTAKELGKHVARHVSDTVATQ